MNLADASLLQRWIKLQLQIAIAKAKVTPIVLGEDGKPDLSRVAEGEALLRGDVTQSRAYKGLRAWFLALSPGARARTRQWMRNLLAGIDQLKRKVEAEGDVFDYAEVETNIREKAANDGIAVVGPTEVEQQQPKEAP